MQLAGKSPDVEMRQGSQCNAGVSGGQRIKLMQVALVIADRMLGQFALRLQVLQVGVHVSLVARFTHGLPF